MPTESISPLARLDERYSARIRLIQAILDHIDSDPEFGDELAQALVEAGCDSQQGAPAGKSEGTHADRVLAYLASSDEEWVEVSTIRKATGIGRGAIANILYTSHAEMFEHQDHPNHKARKVWRLKAEYRPESP